MVLTKALHGNRPQVSVQHFMCHSLLIEIMTFEPSAKLSYLIYLFWHSNLCMSDEMNPMV